MNREYTLHDDTAERLFQAALFYSGLCAAAGTIDTAKDFHAAANTLAAQTGHLEVEDIYGDPDDEVDEAAIEE